LTRSDFVPDSADGIAPADAVDGRLWKLKHHDCTGGG
jgi:hypothetical protein